ncbi:hypothetical protein ACM66B_005547 [Microbotryomycetes sp. NB124-2]
MSPQLVDKSRSSPALPFELLEQIVGAVAQDMTSPGTRRALCNLQATHSMFRSMVQPLLYETINLGGASIEELEYVLEHVVPTCAPFTKTLLLHDYSDEDRQPRHRQFAERHITSTTRLLDKMARQGDLHKVRKEWADGYEATLLRIVGHLPSIQAWEVLLPDTTPGASRDHNNSNPTVPECLRSTVTDEDYDSVSAMLAFPESTRRLKAMLSRPTRLTDNIQFRLFMGPRLTHIKLDMFGHSAPFRLADSTTFLSALTALPDLKVLHLHWMTLDSMTLDSMTLDSMTLDSMTLDSMTLDSGISISNGLLKLEELSIVTTHVEQRCLCQWLRKLEPTLERFHFDVDDEHLELPGPGVPVKAQLSNLKRFEIGQDEPVLMRFLDKIMDAPIKPRAVEEFDSW